jgi:glycerol-3-phosphate acyltransferase PlsX
MRIAVDAMGGDHAPRQVVEGAVAAARRLRFGLTLVGAAREVEREVARAGGGSDTDLRIVDAPDVIEMGDVPIAALRRKPRSSVKVAAELVASGEADGFVTAGNTGAAVMVAHGVFGMLRAVDRPALATTIPTLTGLAVLADSGANLGCRAPHLVQFATMGACYARIAHGIREPRVALLSIGEEATKGSELTREAHQLLKTTRLGFIGNVDAREVYGGTADVIVCDGIIGNVALKVSEGLVEAMEQLLRQEVSRTIGGRLGYLFARRSFRRLRRRLDYSEQGGAPLLGVRGLCIVGHGRSSPKAVRNAVAMAHRLARQDFIAALQQDLESLTVSSAATS